MTHTVRVDHKHVVWDHHIKKYYPKVTTYLVADPRDSLREGDVIEFSSGYPKGRQVRHVVEKIVTPFEVPIAERPPVLSREERYNLRAEKRLAKLLRREERRKMQSQTANVVSSGSEDHVGRIRRLILERDGDV